MLDKLIYILPIVTLFLFALNILYKGNTVQNSLIFILSLLPLMDLKITTEAWGGFKTFDAICLYSLIFFLKDFTTINLKHRNNIFILLFFLLSCIILLGGLASEFQDKSFLNLFKTFPIFIFGRFFIMECLKDQSFHHKAVIALKTSYAISLSFLFIQYIIGLGFTFYPTLGPNVIDPTYHIIRYPGVFYDSQASGQYLAMGSFLFLYVKKAEKKRLIINYTVFVLAILGIILAGSRSPFGGLAIGLFIVLLMAGKKYRIFGIALFLFGVLSLSLIDPKIGLFNRAENLSEDYLFRQAIWEKAFEISKNNPYLGIGSGNYQKYVMRHAQDQYLEIEDGNFVYFDQPENGYLKILVELGFVGFSIFVLLIAIPLWRGFRDYRNNVIDKKVLIFMGALISWMVAFTTVYSIFDTRLLILVASLLVLIIAYPSKRSILLRKASAAYPPYSFEEI